MWQRQYEGGSWRILAYRTLQKTLKRVPKKKKTVVFRKRISAKTIVFLVFKSVNLVGKSDDTKT